MAEYRIIQNDWFQNGLNTGSEYIVEYSQKTIFGTRWRSFKEEIFRPGGILKVPIRFSTEEKAREFIKLQKEGNPLNGKKSKIIHLESDEPIWESID
jgi:hypothetical protein